MHSTAYCLVAMIENERQLLANGGVFAALLIDFSKPLGYIPHELIIAKPAAYRVGTKALIIYLIGGKEERSIVLTAYGKVPNLDPCFSIYTCDLFYFRENTDIASYADDNTLYLAE